MIGRLLLAVLLILPLAGSTSQEIRRSPTREEIRAELFGIGPAAAPHALPPPLPQDQANVEPPRKKNVGLAAIYSLLLPGAGEWYAGGFESGKYFLIGEGALWLTYAGFQVYGDALQRDARSYAAARAGVTVAGKNDQYFVDIGNFISIDAYNENQLRDREPERLYDPAAGYAWQWDSDASRMAFRAQRVRSDEVYNSRRLVVAVVLLNHLASAINAARCAVAHNAGLEGALSRLSIEAAPTGTPGAPDGVIVTLRTSF